MIRIRFSIAIMIAMKIFRARFDGDYYLNGYLKWFLHKTGLLLDHCDARPPVAQRVARPPLGAIAGQVFLKKFIWSTLKR